MHLSKMNAKGARANHCSQGIAIDNEHKTTHSTVETGYGEDVPSCETKLQCHRQEIWLCLGEVILAKIISTTYFFHPCVRTCNVFETI